MTNPGRPRDLLIAHLHHEQDHVLAAVSGLDDAALERVLVPSGWSPAALLDHLALDDEVFWIHAILAGDPDGIAAVQDGWQAGHASPAAAVARYRAAVEKTRALLADADLDAPPRWWPGEDVFPFPRFADSWQCVFRLLAETTAHAGHLDIVRELIDGHQHLVIS